MNFFQRRRFLKSVNTLDLIPVKLVSSKNTDDGRVDLVVPKFRNENFARWFIPGWKSLNYTVHLDKPGSEVWSQIDGEKTVHEICRHLKERSPDDLSDRVSRYITQLYESKLVSFKQIME